MTAAAGTKRAIDLIPCHGRPVFSPQPALTAALERHHARQWTPGLDLAILGRTAWINLVGKRRGARALPPGLQ